MSEIILLGLSSRLQKKSIENLYGEYRKYVKHVDRDLGIIADIQLFRETVTDIEKTLPIIIVLSGGTRGLIVEIISFVKRAIIITAPTQNALASTLHALYILGSMGINRIVHTIGFPDKIDWELINKLIASWKRVATYFNKKVVLIGVDEDYLVREKYDINSLEKLFGIRVEIYPLEEFIRKLEDSLESKEVLNFIDAKEKEIEDNSAKKKIAKMYTAIRDIISDKLAGGIRCFPIITKAGVTPCIVVSMFIAENKILACEADLASLVTMLLAKAVSEYDPFMGNPEVIKDNELVLAHCTASHRLLLDVFLGSHFETGLPYAVQGKFRRGYVTVLKISPDFQKIFAVEGEIVRGENFSDEFCRNQLVIRLLDKLPNEFLEGVFAHHLIVIYGKNKDVIISLAKLLGLGA